MPASEGVKIKLKVQTKASKNEITGLEGSTSGKGDYLKIKVTSPPVEGQANKAVIRLLAQKLKIAKSQITITGGQKSKIKTVYLAGLNRQDIQDRCLNLA